ncbi:MAG: DegT/DnrJ/EryC1/StrS family aminotransferase [Pirellulales bacterium]|nr:DegT/DnrJ/EryC1/StrS family aminotransferase [Pirellulales bacterium]
MADAATPTKQQDTPEPTPVPLIDTSREYIGLRDEINAAVRRVFDSGRFVLGPDCGELEKEIAAYSHARHGIANASGSDALLLALMALEIGPGDEVLCPSYTFFATASAISRLGATPVFVDIEPLHFCLDPTKIEAHITSATRAIIPVHLYGQCASMPAICTIAARHGLSVIEDSCQAIGAEYEGRRTGALGDMAAFSFYPTKNLGGCGDGGMLVTNRDDLARRLRILHVHGMAKRYYHEEIGINSRLDSIQAAVLRVKLQHLETWTAQRRANAERYAEMFAAWGLDQVLTLPSEARGRRHVWNQYIVRVPDGKRDALRAHLTERKIGSEIYYPVPLHEQECFADLDCDPSTLVESERAARETLALPIFPGLRPDEQETVVRAIAAYFGQSAPSPGQAMGAPKFLRVPAARDVDARS